MTVAAGRRRAFRGQAGFSLVEVIIAIAIAVLLVGPVGAWMILALESQGPTATRFSEASQARIANTYLSRDVGSAELVRTAGFGADPGCGTDAGDSVFLQLVDDSDDGSDVPVRTVYVTNTDGGVMSVWRRTCRVNDTTAVVDEVHVLRDVSDSPGPSASCAPVSETECRQVTFDATLAGGKTINVRATRRATLDPSYVGTGGNFAPVALLDITSQTGSRPGYTVKVSSARSSDLDGSITARSWSWDPAPSSVTYDAGDTVATAVFASVGTYTATVTVTDDDGQVSSPAEIEVVVDNQSPIPAIEVTSDDEGAAGGPNPHTFVFSAAGTVDADGDAIVGYEWDFGDGAAAVTGQGTPNATVSFADLPDEDLGFREVKLTVTDALGATGVDRAVIRLLNSAGVPPTGEIEVSTDGEGSLGALVNTPGRNPRAGTVGAGRPAVNVTFSTALSDPFTWDLRRGGTSVATSTDPNFAHAFADGDAGDWQIVLTPDGGLPTTVDFRLNAAPVAQFSVSGTAPAPSSRSFDSSASSDDHGITARLWNFGFFDNWTSTSANPVQSFSHPGTYTVLLAVTDDDGASDTKIVQVPLGGTLDPPPAGTFDANTYQWIPIPGAEEYQVHLEVSSAPGCTSATGPFDYTVAVSEAPSFTTAYAGCAVTARHRLSVDGTWGPWSTTVVRP